MNVSVNGKTPQIHASAWVAPNAVIAGDVEIGPNVNIWYGAVIRSEFVKIRIGANSSIQDNVVMHTAPFYGDAVMEVGGNVVVGHGAVLHHCCIGDNSLIGMGAIILDNSRLGEGCLVAAGALVSPGTQAPARGVIIGNPGKIRREVTDKELESFGRSARLYMRVCDMHRDPDCRVDFNSLKP
jgi:carbonic anhydrase/acetyltransferase-like protein (isoleucine patch superfamily)